MIAFFFAFCKRFFVGFYSFLNFSDFSFRFHEQNAQYFNIPAWLRPCPRTVVAKISTPTARGRRPLPFALAAVLAIKLLRVLFYVSAENRLAQALHQLMQEGNIMQAQ